MADKIDTKALNEKLLKFCGFIYLPQFEEWVYQDITLAKPDLVTSLDQQYRWIWPKLRELGFMIRCQYSPLWDNDSGKLISDWTYYATLNNVKLPRPTYHGDYRFMNNESPALSVALAVEKLIDSLEKKNG